jgi:hypothetical protein
MPALSIAFWFWATTGASADVVVVLSVMLSSLCGPLGAP